MDTGSTNTIHCLVTPDGFGPDHVFITALRSVGFQIKWLGFDAVEEGDVGSPLSPERAAGKDSAGVGDEASAVVQENRTINVLLLPPSLHLLYRSENTDLLARLVDRAHFVIAIAESTLALARTKRVDGKRVVIGPVAETIEKLEMVADVKKIPHFKGDEIQRDGNLITISALRSESSTVIGAMAEYLRRELVEVGLDAESEEERVRWQRDERTHVLHALVFDDCRLPLESLSILPFLGPRYSIRTALAQRGGPQTSTSLEYRDTKFVNRLFEGQTPQESRPDGGLLLGRAPPRREGSSDEETLRADMSMYELLQDTGLETLLLPGGPGVEALLKEYEMVGSIGELIDKAKWVVAEDYGAALVAATGKLDGRRAVTSRAWVDVLRRRYPNVYWESSRVFERRGKIAHDGKFITTDQIGRLAPATDCEAGERAAFFISRLIEGAKRTKEPIVEKPVPDRNAKGQKGKEGREDGETFKKQWEEVAKEISTNREEDVSIERATSFAEKVATSGRMRIANDLITSIGRLCPTYDYEGLRPVFEFLWSHCGKRPADLPPTWPVPTAQWFDEAEAQERRYTMGSRDAGYVAWLKSRPEHLLGPEHIADLARNLLSVRYLEKPKLLRREEFWLGGGMEEWDEGGAPVMPSEDEEREAIEVFKRLVERRDEFEDGHVDIHLLCTCLDVTVKRNWVEEREYLVNVLRSECAPAALSHLSDEEDGAVAKWQAGLAQARHASRLLVDGTFAPAEAPSDDDVERAGREIASTLRVRLERGPVRRRVGLSWPDLLRELDEAYRFAAKARAKAEAYGDDGDGGDVGKLDERSILRAPASEAAIEAAEAKLGIELEETVKEFYRHSNGLDLWEPVPDEEPSILRVEDVDWSDHTAQFAKLDLIPTVNGDELSHMPILSRVLMISPRGDGELWMIEPELVGEGEEGRRKYWEGVKEKGEVEVAWRPKEAKGARWLCQSDMTGEGGPHWETFREHLEERVEQYWNPISW